MENKIDDSKNQYNNDQLSEAQHSNTNDKNQNKSIDNIPEQKEINFQNDNINITIESLSQNNSSTEKIRKLNNNNNNEQNNNNNNNKISNKPTTISLQEKLKNIFLEREKAKLKYNKQLIPEQLKYNSDDEESNLSKDINVNNDKNINKLNNENDIIPVVKKHTIEIKEEKKNNDINLEDKNFIELNNKNVISNDDKNIKEKEKEKENEIEVNSNNINKDKNNKSSRNEKINNENINNNNTVNMSNENKDKNDIKTFRRRHNYINNENVGKEKNLYQLLLAKKMKNMVDDDDEEDVKKKDKEKERKFNVELEVKKEEDGNEFKNGKEKNTKENNNKNQIKEEIKEIKKDVEIKKDIEKEKEKEEIKDNENDREKKIEVIKNINKENKGQSTDQKNKDKENQFEIKNTLDNNIEFDPQKDKKYSTKTYFRNSGVIQLNQNINIEKINFEKEKKSTELPTPQKNKLTINLKYPDSNENNKKDINHNAKSPIVYQRELKVIHEKPKTINRYYNNSIEMKNNDKDNEKSNIMKLLQLIKSKKNEREQIDKEKEKAKEEMYKRSKSQSFSRNMEEIHKFRNKSINDRKVEKNNINMIHNYNVETGVNQEDNKSPKGQEIYSKKNKINNNKIITNYKSRDNKVNNINVNNNEIQNKNGESPNNAQLPKTNSMFNIPNKNIDRIVVNNRMKKNPNKPNINKTNININNINNKENYKEVIHKNASSKLGKIKTKENENEGKSEIEIDFKKAYEKPVYIYNKSHLNNNNKSLDIENSDTSNALPNKMNTNYSTKKLANTSIINSSIKVYNPKKIQADKVNSMRKYSNDKNKEYISNNNSNNNYNYNYNYNNYYSNNNSGINNIYFKKKSSLIESNIDTNASSSNLSKSINNRERKKKYYSNKNKNKKDIFGVCPNYYSMIPQKNNSNKRMNLKVNKKQLYLNENNQNINNENENTDEEGRSFILDKHNRNPNNKSLEKLDSFISKNNSIIKNYNNSNNYNYNNINYNNINYNNINYNNINNKNNQNIRNIGIQKTMKNRKNLLMDFEGNEEGKSLNNNKNINNYREVNAIHTKKKNNKQKKFNLFKIEDLIVIEEKLNTIIECLKYNKEINKHCFDLWNYYFNCSVFKKIEKIFDKEIDINIVKLSINYELISLIICYEYSLDQDTYIETNIKLLEIMELNYNNLMRLFKQIITNIDEDNNENIWVKKLLNIFENYSKKEDFFIYNDDILLTIEKIKHNNGNINIKIQKLLNYYQTENNTLLINYFLQLKTKTYEDLTIFLQKNILKIENEEGSLIASLYLRNNSIFSPIPPPYLKTKSIKKYTLVLDLDETLVNFKIKKGREGFVRLRPFLFGFLEEVSQFYELIIFTSATEAYANSVIEAIEHDKKYFDYIFYRQHTIIVGNDFVKDLTRIGRPLNSTIIIDNMPQNFRFQKENGITIKPFWGQDSNDKTLYDLMPILLDIAKNGGDVRISLNKYKDEIIGKITSNISKNK